MSFNSFLLSVFCRRVHLGSDVKSISQRYQVFSLIYINLILFIEYTVYDIAVTIINRPAFPFLLSISSTFVLSFSFVFLHTLHFDLAATFTILCMHLAAAIANHYIASPMACLFSLLIFLHFVFFLTSSKVLQALNFFLCLVNAIDQISQIRRKFAVTLTQEQSDEINKFLIAAVICTMAISISCFFEKMIETNLWNMARISSERSENLTKEVVQAAEAKDRFISSLSHEIRNPLNSMKGSIEYLICTVKDSSLLQILQNAKLSGEILLNLLNNVLDAAKLRSEKMEVSKTETNFVDIIRKLFVINSESLKNGKIQVKALIKKDLPDVLVIDPSRMLQIMMNLMSNALKFTPAGGKIAIKVSWYPEGTDQKKLLSLSTNDSARMTSETLGEMESLASSRSLQYQTALTASSVFEEFPDFDGRETHKRKLSAIQEFKMKGLEELNNPSRLSTSENWSIVRHGRVSRCQSFQDYQFRDEENSENRRTKGYLKVQVTDTGCGIPEEKISKLFGMFNQVHSSAGTMKGGTGLGLWISKQLCQKMGGEITVYSAVNKGTAFVFYIPVDNNSMDPKFTRGLHCKQKLRCLVVDNSAHCKDLYRLLLEREGVQVSIAENGKEALEMYTNELEGHFHVVLMNVRMPEMSGFSAARLIRKWEQQKGWKATNIYFTSAEHSSKQEVLSEYRQSENTSNVAGFEFLRRPIDGESIRKMLETMEK